MMTSLEGASAEENWHRRGKPKSIVCCCYHTAAMTNLHRLREIIVFGYMDDVLDDNEFILLYDANRPVNADFKYSSYEMFDITLYNDDECNAYFRFKRDDIIHLKEVLEIPERIQCRNGTRVNGLEALCILLARFAYPCRYGDLIKMFGRSVPQLCLITRYMIDFVYDNYAHLLRTLNQPWLSPACLAQFCAAVVASWNDDLTKEMSVEQCLAMHVTTMTSKNRYRELFGQMKDVLKPPYDLDEAEKSFMPGSVRFKLQGGADLIQHTPVKGGRTDSVEYGNLSFEPLSIGGELHKEFEVPIPNFKGVQWPYSHALAKTLEELDNEIVEGMLSYGLQPEDDHLVITTVKDGADGMGDVSIIKEKGDRILPDKAFRAAFAVLRCEVEVDGKRHTVYEPQDPNRGLR